MADPLPPAFIAEVPDAVERQTTPIANPAMLQDAIKFHTNNVEFYVTCKQEESGEIESPTLASARVRGIQSGAQKKEQSDG